MYGKALCIYHSADLDGYGSAAIVKKYFNTHKSNWNLELRGYNYGGKIPEIYNYDKIIVVDISFPMKIFKEWASIGKDIIWIDHHIHAIKEYNKNGEIDRLTAVLSDKLAAIELTWGYFCQGKPPNAVTYLGMYDSWRESHTKLWEEVILPFQYGMRNICNSPEKFPMNLLEQDPSTKDGISEEELIKNGKIILSYQRSVDKMLMRRAFHFDFEGHKTLAINASNVNSLTFKAHKNHKKYKLFMAFNYNFNSGKFAVTIFSNDKFVDAMEIAKRYGGGGHKGAAGFLIDTEELLEIFKDQHEKIFY